MRTRPFPSFALATALLLAGCGKAPPTPPQPPAPPAPPAPVAASTPAPATPPQTFGVANFAGVFSGTLPCADCPGIDTTLTLKTDGGYLLHSAYRERNASFDEQGIWMVEQSDHTVRLQPEGDGARETRYQIVAKDEIRMTDTQGKPIASTLDYSLRRQ